MIHDTAYSGVLSVRIMALRRAEPDMDPNVMMEIARDKQKRD